MIPALTLPPGPLGAGLIIAIAVLPLLTGMGLLLLGRMWGGALRMRSGRLRMSLAADLDLRPRELAALTPEGLLKLRDQVAFDELSGVLRRVAGIASVEREMARARRSRAPLAAVFVDLDGLKRVNDTKGHNAGDELIRGVAHLLRDGLRKQDLVFRYGGDEFVCVLPGVGSDIVEGKLREIRARAVEMGMAFSFGVTALRDGDDLVSFLGRADQLLYQERSRRAGELAGGQLVPMPLTGKTRRRPRRAL